MNKLRPVALVCAGPVSRSPLTRLPNLTRNLTWVKSSSFRIASRAVNALGGGSPVVELSDMKRAGIWVVSVPRGELLRSLGELRHSDIDWSRRVLLILDSEVESEMADAFRSNGASVATFAPVDGAESRYVTEGDPDAVRVLKALIESPRVSRLIEIRKGTKAKYVAGAKAASKQILPFIAEAVECFQAAGMEPPEARAITEAMIGSAMRSYFRAGRRALK